MIERIVGLTCRVIRGVHRRLRRGYEQAEQNLRDALASPELTTRLGEGFFQLTGRRHRGETFKLKQAERILVIRTDHIGDLVMTTSFLRELRRNLPGAHIVLLVQPRVANVVERCPYVDEVLTFDVPEYGTVDTLTVNVKALRFGRRSLWTRDFDLALIPRYDADHYAATILAYFSGARWRVGYSEFVLPNKGQVNDGYDAYLTHALQAGGVKHEVTRNMDFLQAIGGQVDDDSLELWIDETDEQAMRAVIDGIEGRARHPIVALGVGAQDLKRCWPPERFSELGAWLQRTYEAQLLIVGGPDDVARGDLIHHRLGDYVTNMAGRTTLAQTAALLRQCDIFVGNDSAPMHLAAAVGLPVVEISCHPTMGAKGHANSPIRFSPWQVPQVILQPEGPTSPCTDGCEAPEAHCILSVTVGQVKRAVGRLLADYIANSESLPYSSAQFKLTEGGEPHAE